MELETIWQTMLTLLPTAAILIAMRGNLGSFSDKRDSKIESRTRSIDTLKALHERMDSFELMERDNTIAARRKSKKNKKRIYENRAMIEELKTISEYSQKSFTELLAQRRGDKRANHSIQNAVEFILRNTDTPEAEKHLMSINQAKEDILFN